METTKIPPLSPGTLAAVANIVDYEVEHEYGHSVAAERAGAWKIALAGLQFDLIDAGTPAEIAQGVAETTARILIRDGLAARVCQCRRLHPHGCPHGSAVGSLWCGKHYEADVPPLDGVLLCGNCYVGEPAGSAIPTRAGYFQCDRCGWVAGPRDQAPTNCAQCHLSPRGGPGAFTPVEIAFPQRPSEDAIDRDTREIEALIRRSYAGRARRSGASVQLADIRTDLPASLPREAVDAALTKLAGHSDVRLGTLGHIQTDRATQEAALLIGGTYDHVIRIYDERSLASTLQRIRSTSYREAQSMLAVLADRDVRYLAERMDVDASGRPDEVRERVAHQAEANRRAWIADAQQGEADGKLLYRADNEPEWVATWSDAERQAAHDAAVRLLERADRQDMWAYIRPRATRWLHAERELLWVDGGPGADHTVAAVRTTNITPQRYDVYAKTNIEPYGDEWALRATGSDPDVADNWAAHQVERQVIPAELAHWLDATIETLLREVGVLPRRGA